MTPRRVAALGLLVLLAPRPGGAQRLPELRIEGGYASVTQRGFTPEAAALLAVFWRQPSETWTFLSSANLTYAQDSLAAAQGVAAFDLPWPTTDRLRTEVGVAGASFSLRGAGRGGNGNIFLRQHLVGTTGGSFFGLGAGRSNRDGVSSTSRAVDAGLWQRFGRFYMSGSLTRTTSADWPLLLASGVVRNPEDERYDLLDAHASAQLRNGPHDITLLFTARSGIAGTDTRVNALQGSGTAQVTERVAVIATMGRQLADPLRGLPQANLVTFSARLSLGPKPLPVLERSAIAQAQVIPQVDGGGELVVRVFATDTMVISIAGDFSNWEPLRMERDGSFWVARVALSPGKYRVAVRVGTGSWRAPRNLARVRDDFGGESGLVVIP